LTRIGIVKEWGEAVINHKKSKIEGTYDLHEFDDEKKEALTRWAKHLEKLLKMK